MEKEEEKEEEEGGVIKHLSKESQDKILEILKAEKGPEVPVIRKGNTFLIEVEHQTEGNTGSFSVRKRQ